MRTLLLYFPDPLVKAYIHGHYRLNVKTGQRVWIESHTDKRPERHRASFDNSAHRVTHFQHYLGRGKTREALHAFHDLDHEGAHQLARHLGLAGDDRGKDKKDLMESIHGKIREQRKALGEKPQETGAFGPIHRQFYHDAQGAIAFLKKRKTGEAVAALHHPEVGDIDLVWGQPGTPERDYEDGYGLAKIAVKHPDVLGNLQGTIAAMREDREKSTDAYKVLASNDHKAIVRMDWDRKAKTWLLTTYQREESVPGPDTRAGAVRTGAGTRPAAGNTSSIADSGPPGAAPLALVGATSADQAKLASARTTPAVPTAADYAKHAKWIGLHSKDQDLLELAKTIDHSHLRGDAPDNIDQPIRLAAQAIHHLRVTGRMSAETATALRQLKGKAAVSMLVKVARKAGKGSIQDHINAFHALVGAPEKAEPAKPKAQSWHTPIPAQGMTVQADDARPSNGGMIPHRAAKEAYEAIPQTTMMQGLPLYLHVLPSTATHHGAARLLPEDQKAPDGWRLVHGKAYRPGSKTKDQAIHEIQQDLMRAPMLATGDAMAWPPKESAPKEFAEWAKTQPADVRKHDQRIRRAADKLFAATAAKGFVEGGSETPRLRVHDVDRLLRGTGLTHLDFKLPHTGGVLLNDGTGMYNGFLLLTRKPTPLERQWEHVSQSSAAKP